MTGAAFVEGMHPLADQLRKKRRKQRKSWSENDWRKSEDVLKSKRRKKAKGEPRKSFGQRRRHAKQRSVQGGKKKGIPADITAMKTTIVTGEAANDIAHAEPTKPTGVEAGQGARGGTVIGIEVTQETIGSGPQAGMTGLRDVLNHTVTATVTVTVTMMALEIGRGTIETTGATDGATMSLEGSRDL